MNRHVKYLRPYGQDVLGMLAHSQTEAAIAALRSVIKKKSRYNSSLESECSGKKPRNLIKILKLVTVWTL